MKKLFTAFMVVATCFVSVYAQQHRCGTSVEALHELGERIRTLKQQPELWNQIETRGVTRYVPLTVHLVAKTDGTGRVSEAKAIETLCVVNTFYDTSGSDIQFYIKRFNYFNKDAAYSQPNSTSGEFQLQVNKKNDSANLYLVGDIPEDDGDVLGYYQPGSDWVVIQKNQVTASQWETIGHEMGHFLSLPHTFNGWECGSFEGPGNASPVSSCGEVPTERANGTNCNTAGDFFCDTEPDYGFTNNTCTFSMTVNDPQGNPVQPNKENIMSYFFGCDFRNFSEEQMQAMNIDLSSPSRNYLNNQSPAAGLQPISGTATLQLPVNQGTQGYQDASGNTAVLFDWTDVPGATKYVLEIARNSSFDIEPASYVIDGASGTIVSSYNFQVNKKYYWRVKPFNEKYLCSTSSSTSWFLTDNSVGTNDVQVAANWTVFPNPNTTGNSLIIRLDGALSVDAEITLSSILGQVITQRKANFDGNNTNVELSTAGIPAGNYILTIRSEDSIWQEKIQIVD
jgi:hypothetical protein